MDIESRTQCVVARQFNLRVDTIGMDTRLIDDCGGDSLDLAELLFELQFEFEIKIEGSQFENCLTVGDCVELIKGIIQGKP